MNFMKSILATFPTILLLFCLPLFGHAQANNDCRDTRDRLVCGNQNFSDNSDGPGRPDFQSSANDRGCLVSDENQSAWYQIKIQTSGTLTFVIDPNANDDYDFAVYGPNVTCDALGSPLRCSYALGNGNTGLSLSATDVSENAGGDGFVRYMDVLAGQTYFIIVDNFSTSNNGFAFQWGGTAVLSAIKAEFSFTQSCNGVSMNNNSSSCEGTITYLWDFGDGSPITAANSIENPTHYYNQVGTYTVRLTATIVSSGPNNGQTEVVQRPVTISQVPPMPTIIDLKDTYCTNESRVTLSASPSGGKFTLYEEGSTAGTVITSFDPATLGVGNYTIIYDYINPADNACIGQTSDSFVIKDVPTLNFTNLQENYCQSSAAFNLQASPAGGTFRVGGNTATAFNPQNLGAGTYEVTYTYTDPTTTCSNTIRKQVAVRALPQLSFNNVRDIYCIAGNSSTMQATPSGGIFTIDGIVATQFSPASLGLGTYEVVYTYTDPATTCSNTLRKTVEVVTIPEINFVNLPTQVCKNEGAITLSATPAGGSFTINGTSATVLNPANLSQGDYLIQYNYIDPNDAACANSASRTVRVYRNPVLTWLNLEDNYCANDNQTLTPQLKVVYADDSEQIIAFPSFNPSIVGASTQAITYTATDPVSQCQSSIERNIRINPIPELAFLNLADSYCSQASPVILRGSPTGGTFTVNGNIITRFEPTLFEVGDTPLLRYTYSDGNGCNNQISKTVSITAADDFTPSEENLDICPPISGYFLEAIPQGEIPQGANWTFDWQPTGDTDRTLKILNQSQSGTYVVTVKDEAGCPVALKTFIVLVDCEPKLLLPTAFSPNNDGLNDKLDIFEQDISRLDLRIYNRWGEIVFQCFDPSVEWDGTFQGKDVPSGIYLWQASYENVLQPGIVVKQQGKINLLR